MLLTLMSDENSDQKWRLHNEQKSLGNNAKPLVFNNTFFNFTYILFGFLDFSLRIAHVHAGVKRQISKSLRWLTLGDNPLQADDVWMVKLAHD